jgi:hypothetical protein
VVDKFAAEVVVETGEGVAALVDPWVMEMVEDGSLEKVVAEVP